MKRKKEKKIVSLSKELEWIKKKKKISDFADGPVVKNSHFKEKGPGSIDSWSRKIPHVMKQLRLWATNT